MESPTYKVSVQLATDYLAHYYSLEWNHHARHHGNLTLCMQAFILSTLDADYTHPTCLQCVQAQAHIGLVL